MQKDEQHAAPTPRDRKRWEEPRLSYVGDVEDVVQGGEGKLSTTAADPGEPKKTRPSEKD